MPLNTTDWDTVTAWVRTYLLDTTDPHTELRQAGFSAEFIAALPLTSVSAENARALVQASRRTLRLQRELLEVLVRLDRLATHPDATQARDLLARLREEERAQRSQDVFRSMVLKCGTEVFLDREDLRGRLRTFVEGPDQSVLVVDGEPDSGRSYTYTLIRHIARHHGFRPARVILDQTSTASRVVRRLATFVADPRAGAAAPPEPASLDEAVHQVVHRATGAEDVFWFVLDDCDRLDPGSDVWDLIGRLALAVYEHEPVRRDQAPRLVLLGYSESARQLPYELRNCALHDRARIAEPADLRIFFDQYFHEQPPERLAALAAQERESALSELVDLALEEVLGAVGAGPPGESYMRRVCTAVEGAVRAYRSL